MKNMVILLATLVSLNAKAQEFTGSLTTRDYQVSVAGQGGEICSAAYLATKPAVIARGETRSEAQLLALDLCQDSAPSLEQARRCVIKACETDESQNFESIEVNGKFNITRNGSGLMGETLGETLYSCIVDAFSKKYQVKAASLIEAKIISSALCSRANGHSSLFCGGPDCFDYEVDHRRMRVLPVNSDIIIR